MLTRKVLNAGSTVLNILWFIFFGWWLCLMHIFSGIAQCLTIIGIPVGIANFKFAAIALWPVGRRVVSVETARAAREANARRRFSVTERNTDMTSPCRRCTWNSAWLYNVQIFYRALRRNAVSTGGIGEVKPAIPTSTSWLRL